MKTDTDSFDYCIDFWEGALDDEDIAQIVGHEIDLNGPRRDWVFQDNA